MLRWIKNSVLRLEALFALGLAASLPGGARAQEGAAVDEPMGQAVYRIPLVTPPGTAGTGPALALVYRNSDGKGGAGFAGFDWNVEGLSSIERDTKHGVPFDYAAGKDCTGSGGPMYCYVPRFVLDGMDLLCDDATCSSGRYRTQQDDGRKIEYKSATDHWEIRDRQGRTLYYGNGSWNSPRTDAEVTNARNGQAFSWHLARIVDVSGNWIDFEYNPASAGVAYPKEIRWAQSGAAANRKVIFWLDTATPRPDRKIDYRGGLRRETSRRIEEIEIQASGQRVTKYKLSYAQDPQNGRSMLASVQRFGKETDNSTSLPAWVFTYTAGSQGFGTLPNGTVGTADYSSPDLNTLYGKNPWSNYVQEIFADVNRDGLTDLHQAAHISSSSSWNPTYAYLNDGTELRRYLWSNRVVPALMPGEQTPFYTPLSDGEARTHFQLMDLTGDGYPDGHIYQPDPPAVWITNQLLRGGPSSFQEPPVSFTAHPMRAQIPDEDTNHPYLAYFGAGDLFEVEIDYLDMNGDGLPDRVWAGNGIWQAPSSGADNGPWEVELNAGVSGSALVVGGTGLEIEWPSPNNEPIEFGYPLSPTEWTKSSVVDLNGDGLPDRIVVRPNAATPLAVYYNDGAGFGALEGVGSLLTQNIASGSQAGFHNRVRLTNAGFTLEQFHDLNGDGFPDWVRWNGTPLINPPSVPNCTATHSHWVVEFGTGSNLSGVALPWEHHLCSAEWPGSAHGMYPFFLEDLNGDGLPDYFKSFLNQVWLNDGPLPGLLEAVAEPAGGAVEFAYSTSPQMAWADGTRANPGLGVIRVVATEIARSDGRGSPAVVDQYHYAEGLFDYAEREFRGFGVVTRSPLAANPDPEPVDLVTTYATDRACAGTVLEAESLLAGGDRLNHIWSNVETPEGPAGLPAADQWTACLKREQFVTSTETSGQERRAYTRWFYDALYNPTQVDEWGEIQGGGVIPPHTPSQPVEWAGGFPVTDLVGDDRTTCTTYASAPSGMHLVSSPTEQWTRSIRSCSAPVSNDPTVLSHTRVYYDGFTSLGSQLKGLPTKRERLLRDLGASPPITDSWIFSTLEYDAFGNQIRVTDPNTLDDTNGLQVSVQYDTTYQTFVTTRSVGSDTATPLVTTFSYSGCLGSTPPPGLGLVCAEQPPGSPTTNFPQLYGYDSFGRLLQQQHRSGLVESLCYALPAQSCSSVTAAAGETHVVNTQALGGGNTLLHRTRLDGLGRTFKTESPGKATETVVVARTFDDRGRLLTETTPHLSGTASPLVRTFGYDVLDRPASSIDHDGSTVRLFSYEPWSEIVDVHFGLPALPGNRQSRELRRVDGLGRLVQVDQYTDPNASPPSVPYTLRASYDALDQLRSVTDPIGVNAALCTTTHNIPAGAPCAGQDHATTLDYNTLGHRVRIDDMDSGLWTFVYDTAGNLRRRTDAAGRYFRYRYDSYGRPWFAEEKSGSTTTGGFTYVTNSNAPGYGELLSASLGTQAVYTYSYDEAGRIELLSQSLGNVHFDTSYAYDPLDRLTSKTFPDAETYTYGYDGTRLVQILSPDPNTPDILLGANYDALGRSTSLQIGRLTGETGPAVATSSRTYGGPGQRLSEILVQATGGATKLDLDTVVDGLGRLGSLTVQDGWGGGALRQLGTRTFSYDGLGRLKTALGRWEQPQQNPNDVTWQYFYDPLGNLRQQSSSGQTSHSWSYADAARSRFLTQFRRWPTGTPEQGTAQWTDTMSADATGNPATINGASLLWNGQARLKVSPSSTTSYYDVFGTKVIDDVPGAAYLLYPSDDFLYNTDDGMANKFFRVDGVLIATRATFYSAPYYSLNPLVRWVVDPLREVPGPALLLLFLVGSAGLVVGAARRHPPLWARATGSALVVVALVLVPHNTVLAVTIEEQSGALPNGNHGDDLLIYGTDHLGSTRIVLNEAGAMVEARDYAPFGDSVAHVGDYNLRHRFTGQNFLEPDQLYDHGARYYNPKWGRFVSPDTAVDSFDGQGVNAFAYVQNSPLARVDPTGSTSLAFPDLGALGAMAAYGRGPDVDPTTPVSGRPPFGGCEEACYPPEYPSTPSSNGFEILTAMAAVAAAVEPTPIGELLLAALVINIASAGVAQRVGPRTRRQDPFVVRMQAQSGRGKPKLRSEWSLVVKSNQRITSGDGTAALASLRIALGKDAEVLARPLANAERFILGAGPGGLGQGTSGGFESHPGGPRIDIEVIAGAGNFSTGPRTGASIIGPAPF